MAYSTVEELHFFTCLLSNYKCAFLCVLLICCTFRWRQSTGGYVFSILFVLYILQVGSLIIWFTDTGQSLSAEVCLVMSCQLSVYFVLISSVIVVA